MTNRAEEIKKTLKEGKAPSQRPTGVTIICLIAIIGSVFGLLQNAFVISDASTGYVTGLSLDGTIISTILSVIAIIGNVLLMKMNKKGFYIVMVTIAIIFIGALPSVQNIIQNLNFFDNLIGIVIILAYFVPVTIYLWKKRQLFV